MTMRPSRLVLLGGALTLALAAPALAAVGYTVVVEQPAADDEGRIVVRGEMPVLARAEGGLGDIEDAAYHVRRPGSGGWVQEESGPMERVAHDLFHSEAPYPSGKLLNGEYRLEVRVWGGTPSYDPANPGSYARHVVAVVIDNPPEPPRPTALTSVSSIRVRWPQIASANRADFVGYRVWAKHGRGCPDDPAAYGFVAQTTGTSWSTVAAEPGPYCIRVTAARSSEMSGVIDSAFSPPMSLVVPGSSSRSAGRWIGGAKAAPALPPAPSLVDTSGYDAELPYAAGPIQVMELHQDPVDVAASADIDRGAGSDMARSVAGGLVLLVAALHLRRFLSGVPRS